MRMIRRPFLHAAAFTAALGLAFAHGAMAQSTATLRGTVTDAQGAAVPGATIVVRNQATAEEHHTVSDRAGDYQITALPLWLYRLEVRLDSFRTWVVKDVRLEVSQVAVQNARLRKCRRPKGAWLHLGTRHCR